MIEVHRSSDGLTRVVSLRVRNSITKRSLVKICPFPKSETARVTNVTKCSYKRPRFNVIPLITALLAVYTTMSYASPVGNDGSFQITELSSPPCRHLLNCQVEQMAI